MLTPHHGLRFWLCTQPTDMRKSFDGLAALVTNHLKDNPASGQGFIFINRKRTYLKCLYFEAGGYCLWCKRLEQGQFAALGSLHEGKLALSATEFSALVEGLDVVIQRRRKRYALRRV